MFFCPEAGLRIDDREISVARARESLGGEAKWGKGVREPVEKRGPGRGGKVGEGVMGGGSKVGKGGLEVILSGEGVLGEEAKCGKGSWEGKQSEEKAW